MLDWLLVRVVFIGLRRVFSAVGGWRIALIIVRMVRRISPTVRSKVANFLAARTDDSLITFFVLFLVFFLVVVFVIAVLILVLGLVAVGSGMAGVVTVVNAIVVTVLLVAAVGIVSLCVNTRIGSATVPLVACHFKILALFDFEDDRILLRVLSSRIQV